MKIEFQNPSYPTFSKGGIIKKILLPPLKTNDNTQILVLNNKGVKMV